MLLETNLQLQIYYFLAWRKRWFVLRSGRLTGNPNLLEYYKHEGSKKPLGAIVLDECSQIDANVPVKYERKDPSQQFVFDIVTKTRTYYLVAEDSREMSFWVRCLCDLCGFNHENSDQSSDLGTEQQTFRPNRNVTSQNGISPLLQNQQEPPVGDVPIPLPRPSQTITSQSVLIRNRGANGNHEPAATSHAVNSGQNVPGFSRAPDPLNQTSDESYIFAQEPAVDQSKAPPSEDVEYLHLKDFTTAPTVAEKAPNTTFLPVPLVSRRASTDSVFTHEAGVDDTGSDAGPDPSFPATQVRSSLRKTRLDSMPDIPPPPPPIRASDHPQVPVIDGRGFSMLVEEPSEDDVVLESRKKSAQSANLSPIDDSELSNVPLSLQPQYLGNDPGRRLTGNGGPRAPPHPGYTATEYINTIDATTEARFGSNQRFDGRQQSISSTPFSSGDKSASSMLTDSSVFFNSPAQEYFRPPVYDSPSPSISFYASPRSNAPHHSNKGSLHSSTNALSPSVTRGFAMLPHSSQSSPYHPPRIRRSSSVGQLEKVANDLASESTGRSASRGRRSSIDHRYNFSPSNPNVLANDRFGSPDILETPQIRVSVPPPRPPKFEPPGQGLLKDNYKTLGVPDLSTEYLNLSDFQELVPPSPPHTEVLIVRSNPDEIAPPQTSTRPALVEEEPADKKHENEMNGKVRSSTSSSGSASSGCSTGSSSGRSFTAAVFDVSSVNTREATLYDASKRDEVVKDSTTSICDSPKPVVGLATPSIYDSPTNKPVPGLLPDIEETRPNYEIMTDQPNQLPPANDHFQAYTCMAGAPVLVNSPLFSKKSMSPNLTMSLTSPEAPPINRDLKPGRRSLGSDGGVTDFSKYPFPRVNFDDPPVSPPHVVIMHPPSPATIVDTSPLSRVVPPDRPPKTLDYPARAPVFSEPVGHASGRFPMYDFDKPRHSQESLGSGKSGTPPVPGRPPKPSHMQPFNTPPSFGNHRSQSMRGSRDHPRKLRTVQTPDFPPSAHHSISGVVPPPPYHLPVKDLTYVELAEMPTKPHGNQSGLPGKISTPDRVTKGQEGVEYWVLDSEKTEALQKMKEEREKEKRAGSSDARSIKSGKF